jgi:hypothetical protein
MFYNNEIVVMQPFFASDSFAAKIASYFNKNHKLLQQKT